MEIERNEVGEFANLIPFDYMEIDYAVPEFRDMEIDVMLPVSNEMDTGKGIWTPQTKQETGLCTDVTFCIYC